MTLYKSINFIIFLQINIRSDIMKTRTKTGKGGMENGRCIKR